MHFEEEINKILDKYIDVSLCEYRYTNFAGKSVYLEGHTGLISFTDKEINFKLKKKLFILQGSDLKIKEFDNNTAIIIGQIESIKVQ